MNSLTDGYEGHYIRGGSSPDPSSQEASGLHGRLLVAAGVLIGVGVVMSYSTTAPLSISERIPPLFLRHISSLGVGVAVAIAAGLVPLASWHRVALHLWIAGVAILVVTAIFGVEVNGAQRWLAIPGLPFRFQPVEPVKLVTLLAIASVIAPREGRRELSNGRSLAAMAIAAPPIGLLLLQPDLGNAVLLATLVGLMLLIAGIPLRSLIAPVVIGVVGLATFIAVNPYALRRVVAFLDPWKDPLGAGFQLIQSFVAFYLGGVSGVGLGNGRQKLFYLPEAHTDFILALVAEELGLIGVLVVLGAFAALLIAGTRIARRARTRFGLLVAFGITSLLCVPAIFNAAVVMGLLPTKGLTLPFLSYGGTSMIVSCTALGILVGVARAERRSGTESMAQRGVQWH
jgi:cell division protein FtsW